MNPDSLINRIIPTTDSLKAAVMDDFGWYKIATYCNVEGDAWWIQLIIAFIGAAVGGLFAGVVTWRMSKKQADEQLQREQARDNLLREFEQNRATLQKELEDHRDKRQNTWMLLQTMQEFASYILEADKYVATILSIQMQVPNARDSVLFFGNLIEKIEFLWQKKGFLLKKDVSQRVNKICYLMNQYKLFAMRCSQAAVPIDEPYNDTTEIRMSTVEECIRQCSNFRELWNREWDQLNDYMRNIREEIF
ncbi:hypothetical protein [Fibrobacter sp.]